MENLEESKEVLAETGCSGCGAILKFAPGTNQLKCEYCGATNEIQAKGGVVKENDFNSFINLSKGNLPLQEINTVQCNGCGATTTLPPGLVSDDCSFCGTSLVVQNTAKKSIIKPESVLPFKINHKSAFDNFRGWIKKLWFAPNDLMKYAGNIEKLKGMYLPYWTYDCRTNSSYTGERGIDRQEIEHYTEVVNGQRVTKTRTVTVTDWYPVSGRTGNEFDDLLIHASKSLPENYLDKLEPWDLTSLIPFDEKYLSGFRTETYQIDLKEGFEIAKDKMSPVIESSIRHDIGGNHQRIHHISTDYQNIRFKHTLLPVWLSAYRYKNKAYRIMINGQTGEVQGERPYSIPKIIFTIVGVLGVLGLIYVLVQ